jgi:hypothetical protein
MDAFIFFGSMVFKGKMVFAKLKNFFAKLIFFPQNFFPQKGFPFLKYQKSFGGKKINLAKKVGKFLKMAAS